MPRSTDVLRRLLLAGAASLALAGCTTVGPDFVRPAAPTGAGYAMAGDATVPAASVAPLAAGRGVWWSAFASDSLDRTIRQALADSPTLAEADARLTASREALVQARGGGLPQVDATAGVKRQRANLQSFGFTDFGGVTMSNPTFSLYSVGGAIRYDLDLFGGERRRVEGAQARVEAEARRAEAAYLTLTANVALQVVTIATLTDQIAATRRMIDADQAAVELVHKAIALGGSTAGARVEASNQLLDDQALLPPLQAELAAARHALAQLLGKAPGDWAAPGFSLADLTLTDGVPVALPSDLVRQRPDILAAEADLHAAAADIGVATADLYPRLSLTGSFAQGALKPTDLFSYDASGWDFGAGLAAPLFDGGVLRSRKRAAQAAAQAADARYRQTVLSAFVQVSDALQALAADDAAIAVQDRALAEAEENLRQVREAFRRGGDTLASVHDAERRCGEVESDLVRARGRRLADAVRLFAAAGGDWRTAP